MLKSCGWVVVVAYSILVSAQGPLVLGLKGLGLRVWGQGLTKILYVELRQTHTSYEPSNSKRLHDVCVCVCVCVSVPDLRRD